MQLVFFAAIIAATRAGVIQTPALIAPVASPAYAAVPIAKVATPVAVAAKTVVAEEYDPNPQYSFGYDVQDDLTGDSKSQVESRSGDVVQGTC